MNKTEEWQRKDNHFIHPWDDVTALGENKRTIVSSGDGIYIKDSDGNKLIDGPAGMWCVNIGHNRAEMAKAISDQVMELSYVSPWGLASTPAAELAAKLAQIAPGDLNHAFFTTGGSTAVDSALRFVMFRNNFLGKPEKKHVISRKNAYHGSTFLSSSASGKPRDKDFSEVDTERFHFLGDPNPYRRAKGQSVEEFRDQIVNELEQKILEIGAEKVAVFIAEPILASGGVIIPPEGYHKACHAICGKYDVVYISDEVVTAFGRLGHFFSSKAVFDVDADIITSAKGLTSGYIPMGLMMVSDRLLDDLKDAEHESGIFSNGFTYSGHPVSCVAALKNIEIMERENMMQHVQDITPYFQEQLQSFADIPIVVNVRGMGLMGCIECEIKDADKGDEGEHLAADYDIGNRIDKHCQELGLIVRPIINMCVFSPPLVITKPQIDEMFSILRKGLELTMQDLKDEGLLHR